MNKKDIIKISKIDNIRIKNLHNEYLFPLQSVLKVETRGDGYRIIDLISERDITDIDYFELVETPKTKERAIFKEFEN